MALVLQAGDHDVFSRQERMLSLAVLGVMDVGCTLSWARGTNAWNVLKPLGSTCVRAVTHTAGIIRS